METLVGVLIVLGILGISFGMMYWGIKKIIETTKKK